METVQQALIFNQKDQFLVLKYSNKYGPKTKNKWTYPSGRLEQNEGYEDALKREVKEETGIDIDIVYQFFSSILVTVDDDKVLNVAFLCRPKGNKIKLCDEHTDYKWVSVKDLKKMTLINQTMIEMAEKAIVLLGGGGGVDDDETA
jgi:8-oxo-dGTP pyrophosphatase MutT (NUDIX family)